MHINGRYYNGTENIIFPDNYYNDNDNNNENKKNSLEMRNLQYPRPCRNKIMASVTFSGLSSRTRPHESEI